MDCFFRAEPGIGPPQTVIIQRMNKKAASGALLIENPVYNERYQSATALLPY
jgi:hypothetical protein